VGYAEIGSKGDEMKEGMQRLDGANMDIDLATPKEDITWTQDQCPWNMAENTTEHRCAVKNVSICPFFCGIEFQDFVLCCYPDPNPFRERE
jgi:hypothetical protein